MNINRLSEQIKKIIYYFAVLHILPATLYLSGCGSSQEFKTVPSPGNATAADADDSEGDSQVSADIGGLEVLAGVAMPSDELQRWKQDGSQIKTGLESAGYKVDLQYASNDVGEQISQIGDMIKNGCKILIVAPVDGGSMQEVMEQARTENIPVIAYDSLIMNSEAVSYYVAYDDYLAGQMQGEYIRDILDLDNAGDKTYNIEFVAGDSADNNAGMLFNGAKDVLLKYIDAGTLLCQSGQSGIDEAATAGWSSEEARSRFENIVTSFYSDGKSLDAVLASNDSTALGVSQAVDSLYNGDFPVITGQGCELANVRNILDGKQTMSIFKDTRTLSAKAVEMADAVLRGEKPDVNDTESYHNGAYIVPAYLCEPVFVDINNYRKILIDSGFYKEDDLK